MPLLKGQLIRSRRLPWVFCSRRGAGQSHDHHAGGIFRTRRLSGAFGSHHLSALMRAYPELEASSQLDAERMLAEEDGDEIPSGSP